MLVRFFISGVAICSVTQMFGLFMDVFFFRRHPFQGQMGIADIKIRLAK